MPRGKRKPIEAQAETTGGLAKLAGVKITRALRAIRACGNLSRYHPNHKQQAAMITALEGEVEALKMRLATGNSKSVEFTLPQDS